MSDTRIRVRASRVTGELEVEGPAAEVTEWWQRLWPEVNRATPVAAASAAQRLTALPSVTGSQLPEVFGEFYAEFRSGITALDKVLVAAAFVQSRDAERVFTTKAANQLLLDQNIKVANASESVRRLTTGKRVFVVSEGKFRVSASGLDHLETLKTSA